MVRNRKQPPKEAGPVRAKRKLTTAEKREIRRIIETARGDRKILCERLNISTQQAAHISNSGPGQGLIFFGNVILSFMDDFPQDNELYSIMTTKPGEVMKGEPEHE